jgi:hypothetical protein
MLRMAKNDKQINYNPNYIISYFMEKFEFEGVGK